MPQGPSVVVSRLEELNPVREDLINEAVSFIDAA
jgi:hypothetical protein